MTKLIVNFKFRNLNFFSFDKTTPTHTVTLNIPVPGEQSAVPSESGVKSTRTFEIFQGTFETCRGLMKCVSCPPDRFYVSHDTVSALDAGRRYATRPHYRRVAAAPNHSRISISCPSIWPYDMRPRDRLAAKLKNAKIMSLPRCAVPRQPINPFGAPN